MNCREFEMLMADALGDELSPDDQPAFEAHLAECDHCRREYDSARATVTTMRSLPDTRRVSVRREGNRLVIEDPGWATRGTGTAETRLRMTHWPVGSLFRYAAGLLIAFIGGYGLHATMTAADSARLQREPGQGRSLQVVFASDYTRNSGRSDLTKCLLAMSHTRH